jgi:hypothetical protein
MADRKTLMINRADGFLVLPGGLGTLDELFEVWTTATLGVHAKPMVLLDVGGFYAGLLDWLRGLVPTGFLRAEALELLVVAGDLPAALDALEGHLQAMDPLARHETLFNAGVASGDFGPWLETFHADATATFVGLPLGPFRGRDAIAAAYAENPPSSPMRVVDATRDGDVVRAHFVWDSAPDTGGIFVFELRGDRLASLEVELGAPPPPPATADQSAG